MATAGLYFLGLTGEIKDRTWSEWYELDEDLKHARQKVYVHKSGEIAERVEKRRSGMEFMIGREREKIEEVERLHTTGQLRLVIARMRISRAERRIKTYQEEFDRFVDAMNLNDTDYLAGIEKEKNELAEKVERLKQELDREAFGSIASWEVFSFYAFIFGCMFNDN